MKTAALLIISSLFSLNAFAAKMECTTNKSPEYYVPAFQGFQIETDGTRILQANFKDMYGTWQSVLSTGDSLMKLSVNKSGLFEAKFSYTPGRDSYVGVFSLVEGNSPYSEVDDVDCLGGVVINSSVDCKIVDEFSN